MDWVIKLGMKLVESLLVRFLIAGAAMIAGLIPAALAHGLSLDPAILVGAIGVLGILCAGTAVAAVWLFALYRSRRIPRLPDLAKTLLVTDIELADLVNSPRAETTNGERLQDLVTLLLQRLCVLVAPEESAEGKGATFLVVCPSDGYRFQLVAQVGHNAPEVPQEVNQHLSRDRGLAGQAVRERRTITVQDCLKVPPGIDWLRTSKEERFRGRAAAPVRAFINDRYWDVGALCFDLRRPRKLREHEMQLLTTFAEHIGSICARLREPAVSIGMITASQPDGDGRMVGVQAPAQKPDIPFIPG